MNITESNKLIAEFMEAELDDYEYDIYSVPELNLIFDDVEGGDPTAKHYYEPNKMRFHTSWDWLIPVIKKVNEVSGYNDYNTDRLHIHRVLDDCINENAVGIDSVYKAVVEFIKDQKDRKDERKQ